ncbi:MAG TPA: hypothetical protein VF057_04620, partial [Thermoanaerobaculia bacterium]
MTSFATELPTLQARERWLSAIATVVVAFTRLIAVARGPWDWDEMLFLLALRDYDVALHHPHPPGFPLFIAAATVLEALGVEPFRALQCVNLVAAIFIVPAVLLLCRELRLSFETSLSAALIFAFLPNVWFFGGTAFSDVSAIVLGVAACGFLLRGARSSPALITGAALLAVSAAFRPQSLLIGLVPAVIGTMSALRQRRTAAAAAAFLAGALILSASFGAAIAMTGWDRYRGAVLAHQEYLAVTDSFASAIRPSLLQVSDDFFVRPFRFSPMNVVLSLLAAFSLIAAIVRRRVPVLIALAIFGPFWILAWLTLDFHSASRFSIGYMPLLAILVADAVWSIVASRRLAGAVATLLIAAILFGWTLPALLRARREYSPPLRALRYLAEDLPGETAIYVQKRMRPFAEYYLADANVIH